MFEDLEDYCSFLVDGIPFGVYVSLAAFTLICVPILLMSYGNKKGVYSSLVLILNEYYALLLCSMVLFRRTLGSREYHFEPFWSYHTNNSGCIVLPEHIMNVVVFIPIGLLLALLYGRRGLLKITAFGLLLSCLIEMLQFISMRGVCEIDDIMNNTLGCLFGALMVIGMSKV